MALLSSVDSEDFCDAFVRNGGQIPYVLKTETQKEGVVDYNLIIDGNYWSSTLDVTVERPTFTPLTTDSKYSSVFSGQYYAAVWIKLEEWCVILFAVIINNQII